MRVIGLRKGISAGVPKTHHPKVLRRTFKPESQMHVEVETPAVTEEVFDVESTPKTTTPNSRSSRKPKTVVIDEENNEEKI